ncbi:hypothetical protein BOTBODRAFT_112976, partial [Botryobasidium botryosum FD-172 SS1]
MIFQVKFDDALNFLCVLGIHLSAIDMHNIRAHNFKTDVHLGTRAYAKLRHAFKELSNLNSTQRLRTRIAFLSGVKPTPYDCCINSCCCFTGSYKTHDTCPFCGEARYNSLHQPRKRFQYLPIIPRLINFFKNVSMIESMQYRSRFQHTPGSYHDVFDGSHYRNLRRVAVTIEDEILAHKFFSLPTDIALGLSTDGFGPFKNRKQTC